MISGFKFNIIEDKIIPIAGKEIRPHVLDLIKENIKSNNTNNLINLFWNFKSDEYDTELNMLQLKEEATLFMKFWNNINNISIEKQKYEYLKTCYAIFCDNSKL